MERIAVDLIPKGINPIVHCSQNDNGRTIRLYLYENGAEYALDGTEDLELNFLKADGTTLSETLPSVPGNFVEFELKTAMTDTAGLTYCKLRIGTIGTSAFILEVEKL